MESRLNILVVDDDPEIGLLMRRIIGNSHDITEARNAGDAWSQICTAPPDLVITDYKMPGEDGLSLARRINTLDRDIIVILLTAHGSKNIALEALREGVFDYIDKFCNQQVVHSAIIRAARELELRTHLKEARRRSTEAAHMASVGLMAGSIAHEIKNPLQVINAKAEKLRSLIRKKTLTEEAVLEQADTMERMVGRINRIVKGLTNLSRVEAGQEPLHPVPVQDIINDATSFLDSALKSRQIRLQVAIPDGITVACLPVELSQVFLNLINNAAQAIEEMPGERWIRVEAQKGEQDRVVISVTDSGHGIPVADQDNIFRSFFTTKPVGKGTGLGLAISRKTIECHAGTLEYDPMAPNTRFVITLPATARGQGAA